MQYIVLFLRTKYFFNELQYYESLDLKINNFTSWNKKHVSENELMPCLEGVQNNYFRYSRYSSLYMREWPGFSPEF